MIIRWYAFLEAKTQILHLTFETFPWRVQRFLLETLFPTRDFSWANGVCWWSWTSMNVTKPWNYVVIKELSNNPCRGFILMKPRIVQVRSVLKLTKVLLNICNHVCLHISWYGNALHLNRFSTLFGQSFQAFFPRIFIMLRCVMVLVLCEELFSLSSILLRVSFRLAWASSNWDLNYVNTFWCSLIYTWFPF